MADPIREHPDLRAESERRARAFHAALAAVLNKGDLPTQAPTMPAWDVVAPSWRDKRIEAHIDLLLADPDGLARTLAARVGIVVGATAPGWSWNRSYPGTRDIDGAPDGNDTPDMWSLVGADDVRLFVDEGYEADGWIVVPGISAILDPLQALHAALAATEPRTP